MTPQDDLLLQLEWDFSNCPEKERRFCCHFEYLRSLPEVRELFARYDSEPEGRKDGREMDLLREFQEMVRLPGEEILVLDDLEIPVRPLLLAAFCRLEDFPGQPWLSLDQKVRNGLITDCENYLRIYPGLTSDDLRRLAKIRDEEREAFPDVLAVLRIPVGLTLDEMAVAFKHEMKKLLESQPENFRLIKGGRGGFGDKLRQLGAFRLLQLIEPDKAASYTKARLADNRGLYQGKEEFQDAATSAQIYQGLYLVGN